MTLIKKKTDGRSNNATTNRGDCVFVDTAYGGVNKRNNVRHVDQLKLPKATPDCFVSMFRFTDKYQKHCKETGSVGGTSDLPCYCDHLWFDIDSSDLDDALTMARQLGVNIEKLSPDVIKSLSVWFSGSKGFHIGIPAHLFGLKPSPDLPKTCKRMALEIAGDVQIDASIYEHNRLWRVPNTRHGKSKLFKVQLSYDELATLTIDQIKERAAKPEGNPALATTSNSQNEPHEKFAGLYTNALNALAQAVSRKRISTAPTQSQIGVDHPCISQLMTGVGQGQRNEAALRLACSYAKAGQSREEVIDTLVQWNLNNQPPLDSGELRSVVGSAFSGDYEFGCNDHLLQSLCEDSCSLKQKSKKKEKPLYASFVPLPDGGLAEMLYDPTRDPSTLFAVFSVGSVGNEGSVGYKACLETPRGPIYPYPPSKIIESNTIHFPTCAVEYGTETELIAEVNAFVRRYLSVSDQFHLIIPYYILFTWIFDRFPVVPYLRAIGDYGTGKSRFLQVVGALCYRPIFTMGATTISPVFRLLDMYKGTLIYDEGDFNKSDEAQAVIKMLNAGYMSGFPILRSEGRSNTGFEPASFDVYGPKIISTRKEFDDRALESRCLTERMDGKIRPGIPLNLPLTFWDEALAIRNKLLMWRFRRYHNIDTGRQIDDLEVSPRLGQILQPLGCVVEDERALAELRAHMLGQNERLKEDRLESEAGRVLRAIDKLTNIVGGGVLPYKLIVDKLNESVTVDSHKTTGAKVGRIIKQELHLPKGRGSDGTYIVLDSTEFETTMEFLREKFGLNRQN